MVATARMCESSPPSALCNFGQVQPDKRARRRSAIHPRSLAQHKHPNRVRPDVRSPHSVATATAGPNDHHRQLCLVWNTRAGRRSARASGQSKGPMTKRQTARYFGELPRRGQSVSVSNQAITRSPSYPNRAAGSSPKHHGSSFLAWTSRNDVVDHAGPIDGCVL